MERNRGRSVQRHSYADLVNAEYEAEGSPKDAD